MVRRFNLENLRGQSLLDRCLETGFVTTAPALARYQLGRGVNTRTRELVSEHCGRPIKGTQWSVRQHQQSKRCQTAHHPGRPDG